MEPGIRILPALVLLVAGFVAPAIDSPRPVRQTVIPGRPADPATAQRDGARLTDEDSRRPTGRVPQGSMQTAPEARRFGFPDDAVDTGDAPKFQRPSAPPVFERDPAIPRRVRIASERMELGSTMPGYEPPADLQGFSDAELAMPRALMEYILDIGHALQLDFCNHDVDPQAGLDQWIFSQPKLGGAGSLWFTRPVSLCAHPDYLADPSGISSLFHEIGHNLTLNTPARYRFGGKTDGPMSTMVSETLAQIMQHATAYELLNHAARYGLPPEVLEAIRRSALQSFGVTARARREYLEAGCPYATVQSDQPDRPDRTFGTFMTVAYEFVKRAEARGDLRKPLQRMMALLQTFCAEDHRRFQVREDESFRGTLMVAALSHAFGEDLRPDFRRLRFPVDDAIYGELLGRVAPANQRSAIP